MDSGTNEQTHTGICLNLRGLKHNASVMSLHEGSLLLQLLFTYKCSWMWSKVHFFSPWFVCNKTSGTQSRQKKKYKSNRKTGWQFFFLVYKRLSLLFQECCETPALGVVSQYCRGFSFFFFFFFLHIPSPFPPVWRSLSWPLAHGGERRHWWLKSTARGMLKPSGP